MTKTIKVIKAADRGQRQVAAVPQQTQAQAAREVAGNVTGWVRERQAAREAFNPKAAFAALFVN